MKIKGHTKIELTDVASGNVETYEDDNMVTNALKNYMNPCGIFGNYPWSNPGFDNTPLWKNLLGGLFLFDTNLEEDADNFMPRAGVKMIGNGSWGMSNGTTLVELGTFNETESGTESDGSHKLVFDFSTAQANGTIKCACLTSKLGGLIGVGNPCGTAMYVTTAPLEDGQDSYPKKVNNFYYGSSSYDESCVLYADYDNDILCCADPQNMNYVTSDANQEAKHFTNTNKITINKFRCGFKTVGINDYNWIYEIVDSTKVSIPQNIVDFITLNQSVLRSYSQILSCRKDIYVLFSGSSSSTGNSFYIMRIDENMAATSYKITNNTGVKLYLNKGTVNVWDGYLYACDENNNLYGIKIADSTQCKLVGKVISPSSGIYQYNNGLLHTLYGSISGNVSSGMPVIDTVNNTVYPTNGYRTAGYIWKNSKPVIGLEGACISCKNNEVSIYKDPRYLATINNLSQEVVKTNAKTMKVTYTLTFDDSVEE